MRKKKSYYPQFISIFISVSIIFLLLFSPHFSQQKNNTKIVNTTLNVTSQPVSQPSQNKIEVYYPIVVTADYNVRNIEKAYDKDFDTAAGMYEPNSGGYGNIRAGYIRFNFTYIQNIDKGAFLQTKYDAWGNSGIGYNCFSYVQNRMMDYYTSQNSVGRGIRNITVPSECVAKDKPLQFQINMYYESQGGVDYFESYLLPKP